MTSTPITTEVDLTDEQTEQEAAPGASRFADLLDEYDYDRPKRGQILQGVILEVDEEDVIVDVGVKRDAVVPRQDLNRLEDEVLDDLHPGKEVSVWVLRPHDINGNLIVSINKALEQEDWTRAEALLESEETVEAEVVRANKGGVLVAFGRLRAFVPQSHLLDSPRGASFEEREEAKNALIGERLMLKVIDLDRRRNRLVMSERAARREARRARMAELESGQVISGRVVNLVNYGAFVDIGGVDGLVHLSELDHQHVTHPGDVLSRGDELDVLVKSVDLERERISLSRKALLPSPWDHVHEDFQVDDLVTGQVTNVVDFGVFVMLPNSLEGLVHVSQMKSYGVSQPGDLLAKGDEIPVRILDIDRERERIALSLDAVSSQEQLDWMSQRDHAQAEAASEAEAVADEDGAPEAEMEAVAEAVADEEEAAQAAPEVEAEMEAVAETEPVAEEESATEE